MSYKKIEVCASCLSDQIIDANCVCTYFLEYPKTTIEVEMCDCCGNIKDYYPKTEFNKSIGHCCDDSE